MFEINPVAGVILGGIQQQRILGIEKSLQRRRSNVLAKSIATEDDQLEHEVETSDAVSAIHDEAGENAEQPKKEKPKEPADDKPHIDITG